MRLVVATSHFFAPTYRKAGMHQFALSLAGKGHRVDFITVGQSRLKQRLKAETRAYAAAADEAAENGRNPPNIHAHVHRETFHPPSGSRWGNLVTKPLVALYGRGLDERFAEAATGADAFLLECGYPLFFFDALKSLNSRAKYVAFYNDRLDLVGFRPEVLALHDRLMPRFDMVRTNAERLLDYLPPGAKGLYVPQGVDKAQMRFECPSPYEPDTKNLVSIGNMLFDDAAIRRIALAARQQDARVHVIGARMDDPPANVVVHGELPFDRTLPFIVHADVGIAPYAPVAGADYLAQSSLKIQQYAYCGLPVLLPSSLAMTGENIIGYDARADGDIDAAVRRALATARMPHLREKIPGWDEVGDMLLAAIGSLG